MARRLAFTVLLLAPLLLPAAGAAATRYVNRTDATCQGKAPCYASIERAGKAARAGDRVVIQAGVYAERVSLKDRNSFAGASEADRIVFEADPAAPAGSVVLTGDGGCTSGEAIRLQGSRFVTLRGLTFTGTAAQAISLLGGSKQNQHIHIERVRIFDTGGAGCDGGIKVADGNPGTIIVNSLIHGNARTGIAFTGSGGGPHHVVQSVIHGNGWNGIDVSGSHEVFVVNSAVTGNGTAPGSTGGRHGITRSSAPPPGAGALRLLNTLLCGNRLGEVNGLALDAADTGNLTPTGSEGPAVTASPGCQLPATVYANADGPDGIAGTADDDFTPAPGSPAIDRGMDPRTLGLGPGFNPLFEADFGGPAARPRVATHARPAAFDIGAIEVADEEAPAITILQPAAGASVRGSITLEAHATDSGSGVRSVTLSLDGQPPITLINPVPSESFTAASSFDTTAAPDGTHTLEATALDGAGRSASTSRSFIVDNTPPDTQITGGPAGAIAGTTAAFTFTGSDNLTPPGGLLFAWRLDGGSFTPYAPATGASVTGLGGGAHTFEVKARDRAGNEDPTPAQRHFVVGQVDVTITAPGAGATVPPGVLLVRGTVLAGGEEVSVAVNGTPAVVHGTTFAALVLVGGSAATLTATARTAGGASASHSVSVSVSGPTPAVELVAQPATGLAPLTVAFTLSPVAALGSVQLDLDGDGVVDFTGPSLDGQAFVYGQPGLYFPRATGSDAQGGQVRATGIVQVHDVAALDGALKGKWQAMKDALRVGDIPRAVSHITGGTRGDYEIAFGLIAGRLPAIDTILTDIALIEVRALWTIYEMTRVDDGIPMSFEVRFAVDEDGVWRIEGF